MLERQRELGASEARPVAARQTAVEVGILTRGKATLGITLSSLLLQDTTDLRIHIVDNSDTPVVNRDDVALAMRLAFDRQIHCSYERMRDGKRGFSLGRVRLLERLKGPYACLIDDDMALSSSVISSLLHAAESEPQFGCISPSCKNATMPLSSACGQGPYTPGSLMRLDQTLREILLAYYSTTVDLVDAAKASDKVWEVAFLSELFRQLGRPCVQAREAVIYHLDYHEMQNWYLSEGAIVNRSIGLAREMVAAYRGALAGRRVASAAAS